MRDRIQSQWIHILLQPSSVTLPSLSSFDLPPLTFFHPPASSSDLPDLLEQEDQWRELKEQVIRLSHCLCTIHENIFIRKQDPVLTVSDYQVIWGCWICPMGQGSYRVQQTLDPARKSCLSLRMQVVLHVSPMFHTILPLTHLFRRQVAGVSVLMCQSHLFYCVLIIKAQCIEKTIYRQQNRRRLYTVPAFLIQVFYHSS